MVKRLKRVQQILYLCVYYKWTYVVLLDIKECDSDESKICEQRCIELEGGFKCGCDAGYKLRSDNVSCEGMYIFIYVWYSLHVT